MLLRNVWFIASKDMKFMLREKMTLVWLLLMPVVFFYFIGTLAGGFTGGMPEGGQPLAVLQQHDSGFLSRHLQRRLGENGFAVQRIPSPGTAGSDTEGSDNVARLTIPENFEADLLGGEKVVLRVAPTGNGLNRDLELVRMKRAAYTVLADVIAAKRLHGDVNHQTIKTVTNMPRSLRLKVKPAGERQTVPLGFEHAIPGEMVMLTMLVMVISGSMLLFNERKQGLLRRLASTPISKGQVVIGKWVGKMMLGLVQIAIGMLIATILFQMEWGPKLPGVLFILMAWAAFCASMGLLLGSLAQSEAQVIALGILATMVLAALGGCWWPIEIAPSYAQTLQKALPSGWTMDAMHRLISFREDTLSVVPHFLALAFGAAVVGWIAKVQFRYD